MICSLGNICTLFHVQFQVHCIAIISLGIDDNRYDTYTHSTHVYSFRIHIIFIYTLIMRVNLGQSNLFRICFITIQLKETQHTNTHTHSHMHEFYILTDKQNSLSTYRIAAATAATAACYHSQHICCGRINSIQNNSKDWRVVIGHRSNALQI